VDDIVFDGSMLRLAIPDGNVWADAAVDTVAVAATMADINIALRI
jgi:hypothetical protein